MKPLISVVLPVWNGARWLTEAIDSIRRQTLDNFELIVVDDGSTDGSADIIEASARSDRRIRNFRQERYGLVAALNRGLSEAQGQLIARLDADDRVHLQRLQKQTEYLDQHLDVGLLGSWAELIDEQGSVIGFRKYQTRPESLMPLLPRTNPLLHSSIMVRQSVLQKVGFYRPAFEGAEDYDLWLRVSEIAKVANLPEYLVQYRQLRCWIIFANLPKMRSPLRQASGEQLANLVAIRYTHGSTSPLTVQNGPAGLYRSWTPQRSAAAC